MIREGSPDVTLAYLAKHKNTLAISMFSDGQSMSHARTGAAGPISSDGRMLIPDIQPRRKAGIYDIMQIIYPNEREPFVTQRSIG